MTSCAINGLFSYLLPWLDFMFYEVTGSISSSLTRSTISSKRQILNPYWMGGWMDRRMDGWTDEEVLGKGREEQKTVDSKYELCGRECQRGTCNQPLICSDDQS